MILRKDISPEIIEIGTTRRWIGCTDMTGVSDAARSPIFAHFKLPVLIIKIRSKELQIQPMDEPLIKNYQLFFLPRPLADPLIWPRPLA